MEADCSPPSLFDAPRLPGRFVNERCIIHEADGLRVAMVAGFPFHTWPVGDVVAENLFVVQARQAQVATIEELAVALERPERTLYHAFRHYTEGGVAAVMPRKRGPVPGASHDVLRDAAIRRLHAGGALTRPIAKALKCSAVTVMRAYERMGLSPNWRRQERLNAEESPAVVLSSAETVASILEGTPVSATVATEPVLQVDSPVETDTLAGTTPTPPSASAGRSESEEVCPPVAQPKIEEPPVVPANGDALAPSDRHPLPQTFDIDPLNRSVDRFLATQGALTDAAPLFASGANLPYAGILLAVPGLVQSGLIDDALRLYPAAKAAFYGVRTSLLVVVLLSLLRLKRPEHLKEFSPPALGRVLGLDRVPEVKTLRRVLHRLADGPFENVLLAVSQRRARDAEEALAWLYVDGHVRVYNGKERLPMAHVTRMRISAPATQETWVHDGDGRPLLFVTEEAHPSLAQALVPVLADARKITGDRRVTIVFDRGGWSPALFAELDKLGADVLTYRKGNWDPIPPSWFSPEPGRPGEADWLLHDASVRLPNGMWMRQITRLVGEHQTAIVTTRHDLPGNVLARRMFDRWRQENFFKYMRQEFDLDGLIEYGSEAADAGRDVPNPAWTRRDKALRKARLLLQARLAHRVDRTHPEVLEAAAKVDELREQRNAVPRRLPVGKGVSTQLRGREAAGAGASGPAS